MEDQLTRKQLLYRENAEKRFRQQYNDFYNNNKEQDKERKAEMLRQQYKDFYHNNKEQEKERKKKYNDEHKEYMYAQITCNICGGKICKHGLKRHQNTKKCKSSTQPDDCNNLMKMD